MKKFLSIYIHIPFCVKKCDYCDFKSGVYDEKTKQLYIQALIKEIEYFSERTLNYSVNTIYFGGGTPSSLESEDIVSILNAIKCYYRVEEEAEITIEVNPGTVDFKKLLAYKNAGFNRISIGLQSTDDKLLKLIGRIHTFDDFLVTYNSARDAGFDNINVDLMLGLPTQTLDGIIKTTQEIIDLNPEHISIYSLILEEGTALYENVKNNELKMIDEDLERKMYWETKSLLEQSDYKHYEISNFAKIGYTSKHNMNCWLQEDYIGFGLAAHSYIQSRRFYRIDDIEKYIDNIEGEEFEKNMITNELQDREAKAKEYMLLGLRKINGVSISDFERKFRFNPLFYFRFEIDKLKEEDLLEVDLNRIRLTKKGLDFANKVFEEFV